MSRTNWNCSSFATHVAFQLCVKSRRMITCARRNKPDPSLHTPPAHDVNSLALILNFVPSTPIRPSQYIKTMWNCMQLLGWAMCQLQSGTMHKHLQPRCIGRTWGWWWCTIRGACHGAMNHDESKHHKEQQKNCQGSCTVHSLCCKPFHARYLFKHVDSLASPATRTSSLTSLFCKWGQQPMASERNWR